MVGVGLTRQQRIGDPEMRGSRVGRQRNPGVSIGIGDFAQRLGQSERISGELSAPVIGIVFAASRYSQLDESRG